MITYNKKDIPEYLQKYFQPAELGLEKTFSEYITKLCDIFDEVKRVLKPTGVCWVNIGDSYASEGGASRHYGYPDPKYKNGRNGGFIEPSAFEQEGALPKSLCLIPQRFVIEMCNRGWICRNTIIWYKRNCMPSSVKDRFTVDFEYIYFFVKNKKYQFEQQFEPLKGNILDKERQSRQGSGTQKYAILHGNKPSSGGVGYSANGRNMRCVWDIATKPFSESHFATFPEELPSRCIRAGCPGDGIVLDPFSGAGTTCLVANKLGRRYIGIELNPDYIKMSEKRIAYACSQGKLNI